MNTTLGCLSADDLGSTLLIVDGGATYEGTLTHAAHDTGYGGKHRTMVSLSRDDWRHIKSYPSDLACVLTEVSE